MFRECGLSFETAEVLSKVIIKKNKNGTSTVFMASSKKEVIRKANIKTSNVDLLKLLEKDIKESKEIVIESVTMKIKLRPFSRAF